MILRKSNSHLIAIKLGKVNISDADNVIKSFASISGKKGLIQLVSLRPIASINQLLFAAEQTVDAFEKGTNFSKSLQLELLVRAAGVRQIAYATDLFELKPGWNDVAIVGIAKNKNSLLGMFKKAEKNIEFKNIGEKLIEKHAKRNKKELQKIHGIRNGVLKVLNLEQAIIEKCAMLSLEE